MNLLQVCQHYPDGWDTTRPQRTLVSPDHELIVLAYEEALKRGWEATYGTNPDDSTHYYLEVYDCSPDELTSIVGAVEKQKPEHSASQKPQSLEDTNPPTQRFGQRLKELRLARGLERRDFVARVGIRVSYLEKIESGYCPPPSALTIRACARVLATDADELFCLAGKLPPDIERDLICSPLLVQFIRVMGQWSREQLCDFLRGQGVAEEKLHYQASRTRWEICDERQCMREPIGAELKRAIFRLDDNECVYCSSRSLLEVDHIFPTRRAAPMKPRIS